MQPGCKDASGILEFGVPGNDNTLSNETQHKDDKRMACVPQGCNDDSLRRSIADVESVLERNASIKRRRQSRSTDFSVFEWHDDNPVDSSPVPETHDTENTDPQDNTNAPPVGRKGDVDYGMGDMKADRTRMNEFQAYCERAKTDYKSFNPSMKAGIELMDMMNKEGGSLTFFQPYSSGM